MELVTAGVPPARAAAGFVWCRPFLFIAVTAWSPLIGSLRAPRLVSALRGTVRRRSHGDPSGVRRGIASGADLAPELSA